MLLKREYAHTLLFLALFVYAPSAAQSEENEGADFDADTLEDNIELSLQSFEMDDNTPTNAAEPTTTTISTTQLSNNFGDTHNFELTNNLEDARPQLRNIKSMDDKCLESYCYNFHYGRLDEVAFFDIKTEVRINKEATTYDIVNARNYDTLIFENSTFARFPLHLFYAVSIKELDMRNCSIEVVTWECFLMAQNLRILLLSNNRLQVITESTFKYASDLQYLFLDSNRLLQLDSDSFDGLTSLRYLDMSNNRLTQLPKGLFDDLTALEELRLDNNRIHTLNNQLFTNNVNLLILSMCDNQLKHIDDNTFRRQSKFIILDIGNNRELHTLVLMLQLQNLIAANCALTRVNIYGYVRNVDLSYNHIQELYFAQPEVLKTLTLRNNSLEQVASLTRATELQVLDLCDNPQLGTLPTPWLASALKRLNLGNCGLQQLPIETIATQPELSFLNVSHNQLREINPQNFKYLEKLRNFDIRGNDWNCYNLNILMDMLLKPQNIAYGHDVMDSEFPGEYINDIACMYRIEDTEEVEDVGTTSNVQPNSIANTVGALAQLQKYPEQELESFRRELKAIVGIYEQKFDRAFQQIEDLNARLRAFENINATLFQHVTITV
ncbi:leucine-rich repeat-containing protein 15 [Bactrocera dorsalis]|uniref:Leucine-rich repeat-containing protein 15 n=1 Tax=Bactrocera dorsalis TaxID=27457 RepID=A0A6I9V4T6_BACDO|nr:leucine-rich repeat-containing protein 15 [Bactrocera dorsalis]